MALKLVPETRRNRDPVLGLGSHREYESSRTLAIQVSADKVLEIAANTGPRNG